MSSHSTEKRARQGAGFDPHGFDISPAAVDRYIAKAHYLRGQAIHNHSRQLWGALRRLMR